MVVDWIKGFSNLDIITEELDFNYLDKIDSFPDLIINTTSIGLKKDDRVLLDLKYLKGSDTLIYDLIYNPARTGLLKSAVKHGLPVLNGLDMLILQALESFSIWTGIELDDLMKSVEPLRRKLNNHFK